jgi:hypothetical protein
MSQRLLDVLIQTVDPTGRKVVLMRDRQRYRAFAGAVGTQDRLAPLGVCLAPTRKYHFHHPAHQYSSNQH